MLEAKEIGGIYVGHFLAALGELCSQERMFDDEGILITPERSAAEAIRRNAHPPASQPPPPSNVRLHPAIAHLCKERVNDELAATLASLNAKLEHLDAKVSRLEPSVARFDFEGRGRRRRRDQGFESGLGWTPKPTTSGATGTPGAQGRTSEARSGESDAVARNPDVELDRSDGVDVQSVTISAIPPTGAPVAAGATITPSSPPTDIARADAILDRFAAAIDRMEASRARDEENLAQLAHQVEAVVRTQEQLCASIDALSTRIAATEERFSQIEAKFDRLAEVDAARPRTPVTVGRQLDDEALTRIQAFLIVLYLLVAARERVGNTKACMESLVNGTRSAVEFLPSIVEMCRPEETIVTTGCDPPAAA